MSVGSNRIGGNAVPLDQFGTLIPSALENNVTKVDFTDSAAEVTTSTTPSGKLRPLTGNCKFLKMKTTANCYVRIEPAAHGSAGDDADNTELKLETADGWFVHDQAGVTRISVVRAGTTDGELTIVEYV